MARVDIDPADRDRFPLYLPQLVTCPNCGIDIDYAFRAPDGIFEEQDIVDVIEAFIDCTSCETTFRALYEGWTSHEDAG